MIGLFGGSFDPPHNGHLMIIREFLKQFPDASKLLLIPNYISPFKTKKQVSPDHILNMVQLLIESVSVSTVEIFDYEIKKQEKSFTIDTIKEVKKKYPEEKLFLLIGEDNLKVFPKWKSYEGILDLCTLLVFGRKSDAEESPNLQTNKIVRMQNEFINISSTELRENMGSRFAEENIPGSVYQYIIEKKIYSS